MCVLLNLWMDRWMGERMDRRMNGWVDVRIHIHDMQASIHVGEGRGCYACDAAVQCSLVKSRLA